MRAGILVLIALSLFALLGCQAGPPAPETPDQQRFMMGCRPADAARDPTGFVAYCDRF
jgi:uncharacterized protein YcfL